MNKLSLKLISAVLVTSSLFATGSQSDQAREHVFKAAERMIKVIDTAFREFLSKKNLQSMAKHAEHLKKIKEQGPQKFQELRVEAKNDERLLLLITYAEEMFKEFGKFVAIVDEFKHKGPGHLAPFVAKLKKTIDLQELFVVMTQKIEAFYKKQLQEDKVFAEALLQFEKLLRGIVEDWKKLYPGKPADVQKAVLNDICARMMRQ